MLSTNAALFFVTAWLSIGFIVTYFVGLVINEMSEDRNKE